MAVNGGRSQENIGGPGGREFMFLNHAKAAQFFNAGSYAFPAVLNDDGYPTSAPSSGIQTAIPIPNTTTQYTGNWVAKWPGFGRVEFIGAGKTVVSDPGGVVLGTQFNLTLEGTNGRVEFTFPAGTTSADFRFMAPSAGSPTMSGFILCRSDQESRVDAGETWNPEWLAKQVQLNCGKLRFLDTLPGNNSNITKWSQRNTLTAFSYASGKWKSGLWVGTTGGTSTAYTLAALPSDLSGDWADGDVIQCQFHTACGANPTLAPGSRAAKSIKTGYNAAIGANAISANNIATLVYRSGLDVLLWHGDAGANALGTYLPQELIADICNRLGAHCEVMIPFHANDDYVTQQATLLNNNLVSGLTAYLGFSNEVWNSATFQFSLARDLGVAVLGLPTANNRALDAWYARRLSQIADLVSAVYGANYGTTGKVVMEVWTAGSVTDQDTYRFQGADLAVTAPNRPIDKCHVLETATYFYGTSCKQFDSEYAVGAAFTALKSWADDYAGGNATLMAAALASVDADIRSSGFTESLNYFRDTRWPAWIAKAALYSNIKEYSEYEAALSISPPSAAQLTAMGESTAYAAKITNLFNAYKNDALGKQITLDHYNNWVAQARGAAKGTFPSQYLMVGATSQPWPVIQTTLYDTPFKTFDGIAQFNASSGLVGGVPIPKRRRHSHDEADIAHILRAVAPLLTTRH